MEQQQSSQSLTGADRIRALKDDDAIFTAFDTYPWSKDKNFMVIMSPRLYSQKY
jgi:hypothetical protein